MRLEQIKKNDEVAKKAQLEYDLAKAEMAKKSLARQKEELAKMKEREKARIAQEATEKIVRDKMAAKWVADMLAKRCSDGRSDERGRTGAEPLSDVRAKTREVRPSGGRSSSPAGGGEGREVVAARAVTAW